jgi:transketolase
LKDIRDSFFETLFKLASTNKKFVFLSVDMGGHTIDKYKKILGNRYVNVGVSEQNAISVAAGLSSRGFIVCVYAIASFLINRPRAQIRHDVVIANNPINIIGSGSGLAYDLDGPSHHCLDDVQMMRSLPNINIITPFDPITAEYAAAEIFKQKKLTNYIRLDKGVYENFSKLLIKKEDIYYKINNKKKWKISMGVICQNEHIVKRDNLSHIVIYKITKSTINLINKLIDKNCEISIYEEANFSGGIASLISEINIIFNKNWKIKNKLFKNTFVQVKLNRIKLYKEYAK